MKKLLILFGFLPAAALAQCMASGSHYTATYDASWTITDADGTNTISNSCMDGINGYIQYTQTNVCTFFTARCSRELRTVRSIPAVSDNAWTMDFQLDFNPAPRGGGGGAPTNGPGVNLVSLQAGNLDLNTSCPMGAGLCTSCGTYPATNQDAIWLLLSSPAPANCTAGVTGSYFQAFARDGSNSPSSSAQIAVVNGVTRYYIRLQRTNNNAGMLSVFSDATFTTHIPGSPVCLSIPPNVTGLNWLQHGIASQGGCNRVFNGSITALKIDNFNTCPTGLFPSISIVQCDPGYVTKTLVVSGAASGWTGAPISYYYWEAQACNSVGSPISSIPPVTSIWFSGQPGSYTFGTNVTNWMPNYIIRVRLCVQSCGNVWAETYAYGCVAARMHSPVGTNAVDADPVFYAYPNPSDGMLILNFGENTLENYSLVIYDLSGRLIDRKEIGFTQGYSQVQLGLDDGIYLAELLTPEGTVAGKQKVIVRK